MLKRLAGSLLTRKSSAVILGAGHPVLRSRCAEVKADEIRSSDFQSQIQKMIGIMREAGGCGLAAPQVGVSKQLFVLELTQDMVNEEAHFRDPSLLQMRPVPLTIIVNPTLKLGKRRVIHREGCLSIPGYSAFVPRALDVQLSGVDQNANPINISATGWHARILQHETDHLCGKLYVDCMHCQTFANDMIRTQHPPTPDDLNFDGARFRSP